MSIELEYAVKKNIRNTGVVRTTDARQREELRRVVAIAGLVVGMLVFSAWQHFNRLDATRQIEQRRAELAQEHSVQRQLLLNLEHLRSPDILEADAARLGFRPPTVADTMVIERIHQPVASESVVASAR